MSPVKRFRPITQEIFVLYYGIKDGRTPLPAKLTAFFALAYLLSPFDLIPDFIPLAGYLDDLIIVPFLLHVAFRLLPVEVKESGWIKTRKHVVKLRIAFLILLLLLIALLAGVFFLIRSIVHHL
jgi:uncharacterized membrane protein YkvA (DUF1232 family)